MAGGGASSNASRQRKRVEAESSSTPASLKRAKDGSAFTKCEECHRDVAVALISFHDCSLDAKIKMNLEAQVVEMPTETKTKSSSGKRKSTEPKVKKEKKAKNSNRKKQPPTAFFLFMDDFRKSYKEANPDCKKVSMVAKEGGKKWSSMTDEEKKEYTDRAAELKAAYQASETNDPDEVVETNDPDEEVATNDPDEEVETNEPDEEDDVVDDEHMTKADREKLKELEDDIEEEDE